MRPESQYEFQTMGGIPVHERVLNDPDTWQNSPLCRALGLLRYHLGEKQFFSIDAKAFSLQVIEPLGKLLDGFCEEFRKIIKKPESGGASGWRKAVALVQDQDSEKHKDLHIWWSREAAKLNNNK